LSPTRTPHSSPTRRSPDLRPITLILKDEYPPQMKLTNLREARLRVEPQTTGTLIYNLTPPKRGRFEFGQTAVRYLSRLGLVWNQDRKSTRLNSSHSQIWYA